MISVISTVSKLSPPADESMRSLYIIVLVYSILVSVSPLVAIVLRESHELCPL